MPKRSQAIVSRQARIIRLLGCLQRGPGLNAKELGVILGVSRRTVFRDLSLLREAGLEVDYDPESAAYRMTLAPKRTLTPRVFELKDLMHLTLAAQSSLLNGVPPFGSAVREAVSRLLANYSGEVGESLSRLLNACSVQIPENPEDTWDSGLLYQLFEAIRKRRSVRLTFFPMDNRGRKGELQVTKFAPFRLIVAPGPWLVEGRSSFHRSRHAFMLSQIHSVKITREPFRLPGGNRTRTIDSSLLDSDCQEAEQVS